MQERMYGARSTSRAARLARTLTGAAVATAAATLAAQQPAPGQTPVFRTGVELVTVDVGVVDRQGQPIRGLTTGDFTVTVAGQPRRVVTAEFVDVAAARAQAPTDQGIVPVSTNEGAGLGRLFAFIVDQNTLEPGSARHVANAASRFFSGLSFVDRSALLLMPTGPNVSFTWAHDRVRTAMQRVVGLGTLASTSEYASLSEARDIANRNLSALRTAGMRECGTGSGSSAGLEPINPVPTGQGSGGGAPSPGGGTTGGGQGGGSGTSSGGGGSSSGGGSRGGGGRTANPFGTDSCTRDLQMRAEWAWRGAQMTSLSSLTALRQTLSGLARVHGDKTIILISGGWPLDEREQHSLISTVAAEAAAARATLFTLYLPSTRDSASRRMVTSTPATDHWLHSWPLETLAAMTGGASFRVDVSAENAFERLGRELNGFYRIAVEKDTGDADLKSRRMKVQVSRSGATVRAREIFDVRTYEDRNWSARLASALDAPIPATGIGLRVTSYVASDPDDVARLKLVLTGEATRVDPGEATFQLVVQDVDGKKLISGEQPLGEPVGQDLFFAANLPLAPGNYIVRVAVIDGHGRVGSVDHRVDLHQTELGPFAATGPLLIRVPSEPEAQPRLAVNAVRQDERLALQLELEGDQTRLTSSDVTFEIASATDGPALVNAPGSLVEGKRPGWMQVQAVADLRVLPPGPYVARAKVKTGSEQIGEVRRAFVVTEAPASALANAARAPADVTRRLAPVRTPARSVVTIPRFAVNHALAAPVLDTFLERVAARPDARSPMIHDLVEHARAKGISELPVTDTLAAQYPVAAFLRGLTLLSQNRLEHAANAFRGAMRAASDFYPAMVYLGVCYAAGGNDKEAAGAWRTALIKEADALPLHELLADALLRQERGDLAVQVITDARKRWPANEGLKRRYVLAALLAGQHADGLEALEELVQVHAEDEPSLAAGLFILYESFERGRPVQDADQDRARLLRLADAYRGIGGASQALIDSWVEAVKKGS